MPTDIRFAIPNQPGRAARVFEALAKEGINLDGVAGDLRPGEVWGVIHILVEDGDKAVAVLEGMGVEVSSRHEVKTHELEDRPGALAEALKVYADASDNVEVIYTLSNNRMVVATDSMRKPIQGVSTKDARYT